MNSSHRDEQIWLAVGSLMILALVAVSAGLWYASGVMIPFVLAIFIAVVFSPVVDLLVVRFRVPQAIAVLLAVLVVLGILVCFGLFMISAVQTVIQTAEPYSKDFTDLAERALDTLKQWRVPVDQQKISEGLKARLPALATQTVGTATGLLSNGFLILIFVIFLLAGRNPHKVRQGVYAEIEAKVRSYIATKFALSAVTALVVWAILALFGLDMAGLFGMLAFLLNFIPSIGSVIATLLPLPVAVAQFGDEPWRVVAIVAVPGILQNLVGNALEPKLMGKGLDLHPVTILLALAFWGLMWGLVGMVLAVPITASIRIVLVRFDTTRPIGNLLAGELPGTGAQPGAGRRKPAASRFHRRRSGKRHPRRIPGKAAARTRR